MNKDKNLTKITFNSVSELLDFLFSGKPPKPPKTSDEKISMVEPSCDTCASSYKNNRTGEFCNRDKCYNHSDWIPAPDIFYPPKTEPTPIATPKNGEEMAKLPPGTWFIPPAEALGNKVDPTDTGDRTNFDTGAVRETNDNRGRYDLISAEGLRRLALRYELGAEKYADRNWEKGLPTSNCLNSAIRHLVEYMMGMDNEDHLAAAAWNLFSIMHYERFNPECQDIKARLE